MAVIYVCPVCNFETEPMEPPPPTACPNCGQDAEPLKPKEDQGAIQQVVGGNAPTDE